MCANWKKNYNPSLTLAKLSLDKKVTDRGEVQYTGNTFEDCMELLGSSVEWSNAPIESTARGFVYQAIHAAAKEDKLNPARVIQHISRLEEQHKKKPMLQFYMAGCVSVNSKDRIAPVRSPHYQIKFGQDVQRKVLNQETTYRRVFLQAENRDFPRGYLRFVVSVRGKTPAEAGWQALDTVDYYRALWNLRLNSQCYWRMSSGAVNPVNRIVLGPLQTLFTSDLTLIDDQWWHDQGYRGPHKVLDVTDIWGDLRRYDLRARKKINASPCKDMIVDGLLRYVRALDGRDYESVFLKLWSLLEHLTQNNKDKKDVTIIRRAAFVWKDHEFNKEILLHLKEIRNRMVHLDHFGGRGETVVYQLKRYVEAMLAFHIGSGGKFKSKEQVWHFLDLDPNPKNLSDRSGLIKRGIKFRAS